MKKAPALAVLLALAAAVVSCGPDAVKPTADMERLASVRKVLNDISSDYRDRRVDALLARLPADVDKADPALRPGLKRDLERHAKGSLDFEIRRVRMTDADSSVTLHWTVTLTPSKGGPIERKGTAVWTISRPDPPRITQMAGDSPFGVSPQ
jgi:hypothetical protein